MKNLRRQWHQPTSSCVDFRFFFHIPIHIRVHTRALNCSSFILKREYEHEYEQKCDFFFGNQRSLMLVDASKVSDFQSDAALLNVLYPNSG